MITYKKQIITFILGFALANNNITVTGQYCTMKANTIPSQNKEKFSKICTNIDKLNKILKETNIYEYSYIDEGHPEKTSYNLSDDGYYLSDQPLIDLIVQNKQDKVRENLTSYKKELNHLLSFSNTCDEYACYHEVKKSKGQILTLFKALETSVSDYFKATK